MKKTLLLLVLALSLVLSGCSLVVKDPAVDARQVILDINGKTVDKQAFMASYNTFLNQELQMQQLYQMYGLQAPPVDYDALRQTARDEAIRREIISQQAAALGLDAFSEEEQAELDQEVESTYADTLEQLKDYYLPETELEGEELQQELEHLAEDTGNTRESIEAFLKADMISDKLREEAVKDVAVGEDEIMAEYDARVADDKAAYDEGPDSFGQDVNGGQTAYFVPDGYRFIKQVLVKFLPEDQEEIDRLQGEKNTADSELQSAEDAVTANLDAMAAEDVTEEEKSAMQEIAAELEATAAAAREEADRLAQELQAALDKGYENILPKARDIYERAAEGEDFDALAEEFNEDTGMPATGYAVRQGFSSFDEAFVKPAMALENIGDVAEPSPGMYGYYIVQYAADIKAGPADIDTVRDDIHDELLSAGQNDVWEAALAKWTEEADIKEYMSRLEN